MLPFFLFMNHLFQSDLNFLRVGGITPFLFVFKLLYIPIRNVGTRAFAAIT